MRTLPLLGICLVFLISCSRHPPGSNIYSLDPTTWPTQTTALDQVIEEVRVIPLETRPECLINYINPQIAEEMILAVDGTTNVVNCFDLQGRFIRKFGAKGKGPGEYLSASDVMIIQEKEEVILFDLQKSKLNFYSLTGGFIRQTNPEFKGHKTALLNNDLVAIHAGRMGRNKTSYELAICDLNGEIKKTWFPFPDPVWSDFCFGFAKGTQPGSVLYHKIFDYHVYEIFSDRMDTLLTLNFGKAAIDTTEFLKFGEIDRLREEKDKIFGILSLANTPEHLAVNINGGKGVNTWILDHKSNNHKILTLDTLYSMGNFHGIPIHFSRETNGSWFISNLTGIDWFESIQTLTETQKKFLRKEVPGFIDAEKVTMDGNPVVILYKFKAF